MTSHAHHQARPSTHVAALLAATLQLLVLSASSIAATSWDERALQRYYAPREVVFENGYEVVDSPSLTATPLKEMPAGSARIAAHLDVSGTRYYMTDWSFERYVSGGRTPNWIRPKGSQKSPGATGVGSAPFKLKGTRLLAAWPGFDPPYNGWMLLTSEDLPDAYLLIIHIGMIKGGRDMKAFHQHYSALAVSPLMPETVPPTLSLHQNMNFVPNHWKMATATDYRHMHEAVANAQQMAVRRMMPSGAVSDATFEPSFHKLGNGYVYALSDYKNYPHTVIPLAGKSVSMGDRTSSSSFLDFRQDPDVGDYLPAYARMRDGRYRFIEWRPFGQSNEWSNSQSYVDGKAHPTGVVFKCPANNLSASIKKSLSEMTLHPASRMLGQMWAQKGDLRVTVDGATKWGSL